MVRQIKALISVATKIVDLVFYAFFLFNDNARFKVFFKRSKA